MVLTTKSGADDSWRFSVLAGYARNRPFSLAACRSSPSLVTAAWLAVRHRRKCRRLRSRRRRPPASRNQPAAQPLEPLRSRRRRAPSRYRSARPLSDESEVAPILPKVPLAAPRPAQGPHSADGVHRAASAVTTPRFDVLVNQARILTLKQDIVAGPGRAADRRGRPDGPRLHHRQPPPAPDHRPRNRRHRPGDHHGAQRDLYLRGPRARRPDA